MAIILVTHRLEEALAADRVLVMDRGRVRFTGEAATLFQEVALIEELGLDLPDLTRLGERLRARCFEPPRPVLRCADLLGWMG